MSHIVEIKTEVRDEAAVQAACTRLHLPMPEHKTVRLFSATATGLCVQLPGWSYPVVCNTQAGAPQYDNYSGHWGEQSRLNQFLQAYAVELDDTASGEFPAASRGVSPVGATPLPPTHHADCSPTLS